MSEKVKWIKTGQRGARAEFTDCDILTALFLISDEPMGRYKLQNELYLSESSTKSLLNYCKSKNLLTTSAGRVGHSLTNEGKKIMDIIQDALLDHGEFSYPAFDNMYHYFVSVRKDKSIDKNPTWKIRDIAVAYGAEAILFLEITNDLSVKFPESEIQLLNYYPDLEAKLENLLNEPLQKNSKLLIVAAKNIALARKSAFITAIYTQTNSKTELLKLFE